MKFRMFDKIFLRSNGYAARMLVESVWAVNCIAAALF